MKFLRYDGKTGLGEDLFHTYYRIKRPKTGIIQIDFIFRNTFFQQFSLHVFGFIISLTTVVTANNNRIYFPCFKESNSSLYPVPEILIRITGTQCFGSSQ